MFAAFMALRIQNPLRLEEALSSLPQGLQEVADLFLQQFFTKYQQRHQEKSLRDRRWCQNMLAHIAIRTRYQKESLFPKDWNHFARETGESSITDAGLLFEEADSGGLITILKPHSREWEWRHRFVAEYLAEKYQESIGQ